MKKKREHDPVYLVILALGIGLGLSGGAATDNILNGLIVGGIVGLAACLAYFLIKRARSPKKFKGSKKKYRM